MTDAPIIPLPRFIDARPPTRIGYPTLELVAEVAAEGFGVDVEDLTVPNRARARPLPDYRAATWAAMVEATTRSYYSIATYYGFDDRTVASALARVDENIELGNWAVDIANEARRRWNESR